MTNLYLTSDAAGSKSRTIRAIRAALLALGSPASLSDALSVYDDWVETGSVWLGCGDDEAVGNAARALAADAVSYTMEQVDDPEIGPEPDDQPEAEGLIGKLLTTAPQPSGREPSFTAAKCAMILLHAVDGNPTYALSICRALGRVTNDGMWNEVEDVILESFPPAPVRRRL